MIKRTSLKFINNLLSKNNNWKILDVGCGIEANKYATTLCDIVDYTNYHKDRNFVKLDKDKEKLPFKDNEFDFVFASHVLEHIKNVKLFISELERVAKKGYLELPTKLEDNFCFENRTDHEWQIDYDDISSKILLSERFEFFHPIFSVNTAQKFRDTFRSSMVFELYWENNIDYEIIKNENLPKFSLLSLLKKFFSKKIRTIIN